MSRESGWERATRQARRHRRRAPERRPLRLVVAVGGPREGRGSFLGPDTDRRARWWEVTLDCGHRAEPFVRYRSDESLPKGDRYSRGRDLADVLDPPRRVRCDYCPKVER